MPFRRSARMSFLLSLPPSQRRCFAFVVSDCHRKVISHSDGHSILENQILRNLDLQIYYSCVLTRRQYFYIMLFVVIWIC